MTVEEARKALYDIKLQLAEARRAEQAAASRSAMSPGTMEAYARAQTEIEEYLIREQAAVYQLRAAIAKETP